MALPKLLEAIAKPPFCQSKPLILKGPREVLQPVLVTRSDEVMSGAVVFTGTRVPVQTLLDYLEEGDTLDHFLEDFPTVSREHAVAVLELAKESVIAQADS